MYGQPSAGGSTQNLDAWGSAISSETGARRRAGDTVLTLRQCLQELQESPDTLFGLIHINLMAGAFDHRHSGIRDRIADSELVTQRRQWTSRWRQYQSGNFDLRQQRCDIRLC